MNERELKPVLRRWGFYVNSRLAYAGVAVPSIAPELAVWFMEAEHHSHTATLPQRIHLERKIREAVRADIRRTMGLEWLPIIRFEPARRSEPRLAQAVFGAIQTNELSGG